MAQSQERRAARKQRYQELIALNFSPKEARRLRDQSSTKRTDYVEYRRIELERKNPEQRDSKEQNQLNRLRDRQRMPSGLGGDSENDRLENFSRWSNKRKGGFPNNVRAYIAKINDEAGKDATDHYGYRVFYWRYVYGLDDPDSRARVESRDS